MNCKNSAVAYLFNSNVLSTGWFLGPRGPIVLRSVGPVLSSVQEFLLLFIPSYPSPPTSTNMRQNMQNMAFEPQDFEPQAFEPQSP